MKMTGAGLRLRADLHTHSIYSDGFYAPEELCRRAKENGVELLSITDHDTMNGEEKKRAAAEKYGLKYLSGWEISAYAGGCKVHVTGYNCRRDGAYLSFMRERLEKSYERAEDSIRKLRAAGIPVTLKAAEAHRADPGSPLHTMHIAGAAAELTAGRRGKFTRNTSRPAVPPILSSAGRRRRRRQTVSTPRAASRPSPIRGGSRCPFPSGRR